MSTRKITEKDKCKICLLPFTESSKELFPLKFNKNKDGTKRTYYRRRICKKCINKAKYLKNLNKFEQNREEYRKFKESYPCADCGQTYPYYVLHFDHLDDKKYHISQRSSTKLKNLMSEIDKCEIVCANCHAERTHKRLTLIIDKK